MRIRIAIVTCTTLLSIGLGASLIADDWPPWRGPKRNGVVAESSGYENGVWPLREAWRTDVGEGSSSVLVVDGRLYTIGWRDGADHVVCLDAETGQPIWRQTYKAPRYGRLATGDQGLYSGPSSTPEFDAASGLLFTLGCDGDLYAWDVRSEGQRVWHRNLYEDFDVPRRPKVGRSGLRDYGYTSSPLVVGEQLIVEVGARQGNLIAFDKRTGKIIWHSQSTSPAGHNGGPVPIAVEGVPCVAVHNFDGLLVARIDRGREGETVATYPWVTEFANNIATVAVHGDSVLITSSYNQHKIARLRISLRGAEKVWEQKEASKVCSPLVYNGHVYWAWRTVNCLDYQTGKVRWQGGRVGDPGSMIATSDERLIVWSGRGELSLIESAKRSPDRYQRLASRQVFNDDDAWPHVVLAAGRIYCKDRQGQLVCLELSGR